MKSFFSFEVDLTNDISKQGFIYANSSTEVSQLLDQTYGESNISEVRLRRFEGILELSRETWEMALIETVRKERDFQ